MFESDFNWGKAELDFCRKCGKLQQVWLGCEMDNAP